MKKINKIISNILFILKLILKNQASILVFYIIMQIVNTLDPLIFMFYITKVINILMSTASLLEILEWTCLMIIWKLISSVICGWINIYMIPTKSLVLSKKLHLLVYEKSRNVDYSSYESPDYFDKFSISLEQMDSRVISVIQDLAGFFGCILGISSYIAIISMYDAALIIIVIINVLIITCFTMIIAKIQNKRYKESIPFVRKADYSKRIFYLFENAKEIRLNEGINQLLLRDYENSMYSQISLIKKYARKTFPNFSLEQLILVLTLGIEYMQISRSVVSGSILVTNFYLLLSGVSQMIDQMLSIIKIAPNFYEHSLYMEPLVNFLRQETEDILSTTEINEIHEIALEHVSFWYNEDNIIIDDISIVFQKGIHIILGENGAGKSTLLSLLCLLRSPNDGYLFVNSIKANNFNKESYYDKMGVLFQDYVLFAFSIAENILMRKIENENDEKKVQNALKIVGLYDKIKQLPNGINTQVYREFDNEGCVLSGGEAQRLAMARLLVNNYDVIILDEPCSSISLNSRRIIMGKIFDLYKNKIVFVVTHDIDWIDRKANIFTLNKGKLEVS